MNEVTMLKEGMIAIRRLTWDVDADNSRIISDIADAMHNGFNPIDELGMHGAVRGLLNIKEEHPELETMMSHSFEWASNKGAEHE